MKRVERRRVERLRRTATVVGLSFAIGALVDVGLTWRLREPAVVAEVGDAPPPYDVAAGPDRVASVPVDWLPVPLSGSRVNPAPPLTPAEVQASQSSLERADPATIATAGAAATAGSVDALRARRLTIPVSGVDADDLHDTYDDLRGGTRPHEALDIMSPRNTPVVAVEDGRVEKLFTSDAGGLTIYQFDPSGSFAYYYAHLDRYAAGLREGQTVRRGDVIGYVGSTGNASPDAPHLHFAIFRLNAERQWWKGDPINPYRVLE